jgi:hypothetical protein
MQDFRKNPVRLLLADVAGFLNFTNRQRLVKQLTPYDVGYRKIRLGGDRDGGYIVADCQLDTVAAMYSFGIADDDLFDLAFAQNFKKPVYQYDPFVEKSPSESINPLIRFNKRGVSDRKTDLFDTLENFVRENGHTDQDLFLKMDIEGAEWEVFASIPPAVLQQFSQIVLEFHGFEFFSRYDHYIRCLEIINAQFVLFHVHGNNGLGKPAFSKIPCLLEASFINKKYVAQKTIATQPCPSEIDRPNCPTKPELRLDYWLS